MTRSVYLDYNALTPVLPEAADAACQAMGEIGNPSSVHCHGRRARRLIEDAREVVASLVGVPPSWVVFTSGGTEANALALRAANGKPVVISAIEHPSILAQTPDALRVPVTRDGGVDLAVLESTLANLDETAFVSVMLANNETGVIQPITAISEIAHRHGAIVHCDAVQAAGKIAVDMQGLGVDMLSLSSHKVGGLSGCGALIVNPATPVSPLLVGGGQERSLRAGTENVVGISAFGAAARVGFRPQESNRLMAMRNGIEAAIQSIDPSAKVFGAQAERLPNTSCVHMPGAPSERQIIAFDLMGISVSAGAACSSGKVRSSHVLAAMTPNDPDIQSVVRVSLGWKNTKEDCERFVDAWRTVCMRTRDKSAVGATAA